ncbi:hypothetical protein BDY24DRAFT_409823 [Mrakia frigida]|uniref:uncharacterized protein n=1 Tax=Mrakia frigida TaxID=29902 RepID=UPI003FCBF1EC
MSSSPPRPPPPPSPFQTRLLTRFPPLGRLHLLAPSIPLPSLVLSFAILHELTAFLPVIGIFFGLREIDGGRSVVQGMIDLEGRVRGRTRAQPPDGSGGGGIVEKGWVEGWLQEGERKVEWVGGRYGVLGFEKKEKAKGKEREVEDELVRAGGAGGESIKATTSAGDLGKGVAGDVANALGAYMIVKALLPLRIAASVYLSPAFARALILPVHRVWHRTNGLGVFRSRK